ncbi:hypothetical protein DL96DRAFT_272143 [Flagelloscypha sp. PMI_526]|nr:hypothetical protein DL96DRAFT_272143 [Flagelloscypha sp. PMI_526]
MDLLSFLGGSLEIITSAARVVNNFWLVDTTKTFPPLSVDIARTICEFAAALDKTTASSLYMTSKDIRIWVTPIHFRRVLIRSHESLLLLKAPGTLERIAPHVYSVSLQPLFGDDSCQGPSQLAMDFDNFLKALPNLVHFRWPVLPHRSMWSKVSIVLPKTVSSLEIGDAFLEVSPRRNNNFNRTQITHIHSDLIHVPYSSFFSDWSTLTHLFFEIRPQDYSNASIARSTFPISPPPFSRLPTSIVSCVLMDSQSSAWRFNWTVNRVLVNLVLGDTDPRVVFAAGETRERWMVVDRPGVTVVTPPEKDLSWIRIGLKDAILYHNHNQRSYESIWEQAEVVRRKRSKVEIRKAVYQLLQYGS